MTEQPKGEPRKYRKKPVVIEAIQWTGKNEEDVAAFCPGTEFNVGPVVIAEAFISTLEGCMVARAGDWIIRGVKGEFYPCKPEIFAADYEPAETDPPSPTPDGPHTSMGAASCVDTGSVTAAEVLPALTKIEATPEPQSVTAQSVDDKAHLGLDGYCHRTDHTHAPEKGCYGPHHIEATPDGPQDDIRTMLWYALHNRCPACGWPLAESADKGCVMMNCCFRPSEHDPLHDSWLRRAKLMAEISKCCTKKEGDALSSTMDVLDNGGTHPVEQHALAEAAQDAELREKIAKATCYYCGEGVPKDSQGRHVYPHLYTTRTFSCTSKADAILPLLRSEVSKAREDEHLKLCPICGDIRNNPPSPLLQCDRLADLKRTK